MTFVCARSTRRPSLLFSALATAAMLSGCPEGPPTPSPEPEPSTVGDAGEVDARPDTGPADAGTIDAGVVDAGGGDAGPPTNADAGSVAVDAGAHDDDAGRPLAPDAGEAPIDAGPERDAGAPPPPDAGSSTDDAGTLPPPDAGGPTDGGPADGGDVLGPLDSGRPPPPTDSGLADAGAPATDAGTSLDDGGSPVEDAGVTDGGVVDAGQPLDVPVYPLEACFDQAPYFSEDRADCSLADVSAVRPTGDTLRNVAFDIACSDLLPAHTQRRVQYRSNGVPLYTAIANNDLDVAHHFTVPAPLDEPALQAQVEYLDGSAVVFTTSNVDLGPQQPTLLRTFPDDAPPGQPRLFLGDGFPAGGGAGEVRFTTGDGTVYEAFTSVGDDAVLASWPEDVSSAAEVDLGFCDAAQQTSTLVTPLAAQPRLLSTSEQVVSPEQFLELNGQNWDLTVPVLDVWFESRPATPFPGDVGVQFGPYPMMLLTPGSGRVMVPTELPSDHYQVFIAFQSGVETNGLLLQIINPDTCEDVEPKYFVDTTGCTTPTIQQVTPQTLPYGGSFTVTTDCHDTVVYDERRLVFIDDDGNEDGWAPCDASVPAACTAELYTWPRVKMRFLNGGFSVADTDVVLLDVHHASIWFAEPHTVLPGGDIELVGVNWPLDTEAVAVIDDNPPWTSEVTFVDDTTARVTLPDSLPRGELLTVDMRFCGSPIRPYGTFIRTLAAGDPELHSLSMMSAPSGVLVHAFGSGFAASPPPAGDAALLTSAGVTAAVSNLQVLAPNLAMFMVPHHTTTGTWGLRLQMGSGTTNDVLFELLP